MRRRGQGGRSPRDRDYTGRVRLARPTFLLGVSGVMAVHRIKTLDPDTDPGAITIRITDCDYDGAPEPSVVSVLSVVRFSGCGQDARAPARRPPPS